MILRNKCNEVRSGFKIILVILLTFIMSISLSMCIGGIASLILIFQKNENSTVNIMKLNNILNSDIGFMINISLNNLIFIFACIVMWKIFEKKKISAMGLISLKKGYMDLIMGLIMGAMTISVVAIVLLLVGDVKLINPVNKPQISTSLLTGIVSFIFVGFGEEILGRGYIMSVLKQTRNKWIVIIVSSLIFAALHLSNNGISVLAFINLTLVGMLFAYMYMKSKNIWMSIGYHITWNYFQGYVWGFQVSGITTKGLYSIKNINDNIINGGAFGPEGGLVVTVITLIAFYGVHLYYKNKNIDSFIDIIDNKEIIYK